MMGPGARSILTNALFLFGGQGVTLVVRAAYSVTLAILLGPELFGYYNYGLAWYILLLPITSLGIGMVLSREIGADRDTAAKLLPQTLMIRSGAALVTALTMMVVAWAVEPEPLLRALLALMGLALVARAVSLWATVVFIAFEEARWSFQQDSFFRTAEVIVGVLVAYLTLDILAVAGVHAISWIAQAARGLWLVRRRYGALRLGKDTLGGSWAIVRIGIPIGIVGVISGWFLQGPVVLARFLVEDAGQMGQVVMAIQILGYVALVPQMVAVAAVPVLSRSAARGDRKDAAFVSLAIRGAIVVGGFAALAGSAFGESVIRALLGDRYGDAAVMTGDILWAAIPFACGAIATQSLMTRRLVASTLFASTVAGAIFTAIIAYSLIVRPLPEIAWAILAGFSLWAAVLCWRLNGLGLILWAKDMWVPAGVVAIAAAVFLTASSFWSGWPFILAAASLGAGTVILVVPEESRRLWRKVRPVR